MNKLVLSAFSAVLIVTTPLSSYQLVSPLLDHINFVSEKTHDYKVSILNNEEEDIEAEILFSGLIQKKDGLATLAESLPDGIKVTDLNKNYFIPKGQRKEFMYRIDTSEVLKDIPFSALGILIGKKEQNKKSLSSKEVEKVEAGFIIRQKFLVQLMMKLQKTGIGKAEIDEVQFTDDKILFTVKNPSKHLLEGDVTLFAKNLSNKTNDPINYYVRVLPENERIYSFDFKNEDINCVQLFFDNPHFELIEKEQFLKK
jgi:hypothetical protein